MKKYQRRIKDAVIMRDGLVCCFCDTKLTLEQVTLDHINPRCRRGMFNCTNLTVACRACNNNRNHKDFFNYAKQFNWNEAKFSKYRKLWLNNLKIKVLNIVNNEFLNDKNCEYAIPNNLIYNACQVLKIKTIYLHPFDKNLSINLDQECARKDIIINFNKIIMELNS